MQKFFFENIYWIIPTAISTIFSSLAFVLSTVSLVHTHKMQAESMRFQLSTKRFEVYNSLQKLYNEIFNTKSITVSTVDSFKKLSDEASLIFGEDVIQCCNRTLKLLDCHMHRNFESNKSEYVIIESIQRDLSLDYSNACLHLIKQEYDKITTLMPQYLEFSKYKQRRIKTNRAQ